MALSATITSTSYPITITDTTYPLTVSAGAGDSANVAVTVTTSNITVTQPYSNITINTNSTEIRTETLAERFGGEWESLESYVRGDVIRYQQAIYVCISDVTSAVTPNNDAVHWTLIFSEQGLTAEQVIALNRADHLKAWSSNISYSQNDWVYGSNYRIYTCINASGSANNNPISDTTNVYWRMIGGVDTIYTTDLADVSSNAATSVGQTLVWTGNMWEPSTFAVSNIYDFGTFSAPSVIMLDLGSSFS
jgi:hypothetical protein